MSREHEVNVVTTAGELRTQATELLCAAKVPRTRAQRTAGILVVAEAWGRASHGLMRLPYYLARLHAGGCRPDAELDQVTDTGPLVTYEGNAGLGHWQAWDAAAVAAERCAQFGIAAVSVRNSSHCGALGTYVHPMLRAGQIGLMFSNGPAVMPPWGGARPLLSTSPLAAGVPCRPEPIVVDMATSAVARGKIAAAAQAGQPLPEGWALTKDGVPTTDAQQALMGMLAPLGGAKGFALALVVEAMSAGLAGPQLSKDVPDMFDPADDARPQGIGHLLIALDSARFDAGGPDRLDELAAQVQTSGGRIPGAGKVAPDDLDDGTELRLAPETMARLEQWADRLGVS